MEPDFESETWKWVLAQIRTAIAEASNALESDLSELQTVKNRGRLQVLRELESLPRTQRNEKIRKQQQGEQ